MNSFRDTAQSLVQHLTVDLRSFGKMALIFGSISCLYNTTMRQGQQDGY
jgi:hypothetical protein